MRNATAPPQVRQRHQQLPERERARAHVAHPDEQHGGRARRGRQPHQQAVPAFEQRQTNAGHHAFARAAHEAFGLAGFLPERLHDTQGPQRLLHDRERRGFQLLHAARLTAHAGAVDRGEHEQGRRHR
ncbi:MAG: hypothetical protein AUG75_09170 [Cyanobacteria bacterium 13_1_20CM_4_61_6]|nr:MAG: hypothetical protein AUG75_09170 [Cyanobacteria bacterium 13_1_20CM_4_61_6]